MKEITQVHIARVPFSIERDAEKQLQAYLDAIGRVTTKDHRDDLVDEVESRIVEILNDRGVKRGGTITVKEVVAIREQLGEPKDFASDHNEDTVDEPEDAADSSAAPANGVYGFFKRKLYRDEKRGVIAGVCYGIAKMIDIDPLWVRLLFLCLIFLHGAGIIIYFILAILVPNVASNADRLKMEGKPVNIESLRWLKGEQAKETATRVRSLWERLRTMIARVLRVSFAGMVAVIGLLCIVTLLGLFLVMTSMLGGADKDWFGAPLVSGHWTVAVFVLASLVMIASAVLLFALGVRTVLVELGLRVKGAARSARMIGIVASALFVIALLAALSVAYPTSREVSRAVHDASQAKVTSLTLAAKTVDIQSSAYVLVRQDVTPRVEIKQAFPERANQTAVVTEKDGVVTVRDRATGCKFMCFDVRPTVTIYTANPADVTIKNSEFVDLFGSVGAVAIDNQAARYYGGINVHGSIRDLRLQVYPDEHYDLTGALIGRANVTFLDSGVRSSLRLGKVDEVNVTAQTATKVCYSRTDTTAGVVAYGDAGFPLAVGSFGKFILNGKDVTVQAVTPIAEKATIQDMYGCLRTTHYVSP